MDIPKNLVLLSAQIQDELEASLQELEDFDAELLNHSSRVGLFSTVVAYEYEKRFENGIFGKADILENSDYKLIGKAGYLHDWGKVGMHFLNEDRGLTNDEVEMMQKHPERTYHKIMMAGYEPIIAQIAIGHHEFQKNGYPRKEVRDSPFKLHGEIIAVVDHFDALANTRSYKPAWPLDRIIAEVRENTIIRPELIQIASEVYK